ncbi:MAG: hypothetical protein AB7E76_08575 [Deferribacterales bacterium]|jgi:hypothetical protein
MIRKLLGVLLIIACFANAGFAYKLTLNGYNDTEFRFIGNSNVGGDDVSSKDASYIKQQLRIWAFLDVDDKTQIIMRTTPINHRWGEAYNHNTGIIKGTSILGRAWVKYQATDELTLHAGFMTAANYSIKGWAQGWYNGGFTEFGARSGGRAEYVKGPVKLWAQYEKTFETDDDDMFYDVDHNRDSDALIAGTDVTYDTVKLHAYGSYYSTYGADVNNDDRSNIYGTYLSAEFQLSEKLSTTFSTAYVAGKAYDNQGIYMKLEGEDVKAYGAYADVRYEGDFATFGVDAEYSSYDKEDGFFSVGGDLDRMKIMDDVMGDNRGVPASTSLRVFASKKFDKLTFTPALAYYRSNITDDDVAIAYGRPFNAVKTWTKDTTALEADLRLSYKLSEAITLNGGYSLAMLENVSSGVQDANGKYASYDPDPVSLVWFQFFVSFK